MTERLVADELVIGLVGPVGAGVSTTGRLIASILADRFGYETETIRVSDLIRDAAPLVGRATPGPDLTGDARIAALQEVGSRLRGAFSDRYLAQKCVERIAAGRSGGRRAVLIDSLKNPAEVALLRQVYGDRFWLFGVFAPEEVRRQRLRADGADEAELPRIMQRDEAEGVGFGQRVRETIDLADFFLRNDADTDGHLRRALQRYLEVLFGVAVHTPTLDETAMGTAWSAAAGSACLSRQVGAAIFSAAGELIGVGANDVPKAGGGLYQAGDGDADHRCFQWGGKVCHNDDRKDRLYGAVFEALDGLLAEGADRAQVTERLRGTDIRNLIEYSRAVHAEIEAILSVARGARQGLVGATLYVTTFPCHHCARHIVASGIARVVYVEPYAKSLALALHRDAISVREGDGASHVLFLQYEGVAPRNLLRLFRRGERKQDGRLVARDPRRAQPLPLDDRDAVEPREAAEIARLAGVERSAAGHAATAVP